MNQVPSNSTAHASNQLPLKSMSNFTDLEILIHLIDSYFVTSSFLASPYFIHV